MSDDDLVVYDPSPDEYLAAARVLEAVLANDGVLPDDITAADWRRASAVVTAAIVRAVQGTLHASHHPPVPDDPEPPYPIPIRRHRWWSPWRSR